MANKQLVIDSNLDKEYKAYALLVCIAREIEQAQIKLLKQYGLSITQLNILDVLDNSNEDVLTVNQIRERMYDDNPNVSRSLNKLMENNLIIKERGTDDQRIVRIRITDEGVKLHREADLTLIKHKGESGLSEKETEQLYDLLVKL